MPSLPGFGVVFYEKTFLDKDLLSAETPLSPKGKSLSGLLTAVTYLYSGQREPAQWQKRSFHCIYF